MLQSLGGLRVVLAFLNVPVMDVSAFTMYVMVKSTVETAQMRKIVIVSSTLCVCVCV